MQEQWYVYIPFRFTHPLADKIRRTDTEECALRLGRHRFGKITLTRPRRSIEKDASPRCTFSSEEMGELDG